MVTAIRSGSLSIVASALDSLLDLLAGAILWFTKWSMQDHNKYKYPIGKSRVQPVGIVVFAAVMATLGTHHDLSKLLILEVFTVGLCEPCGHLQFHVLNVPFRPTGL